MARFLGFKPVGVRLRLFRKILLDLFAFADGLFVRLRPGRERGDQRIEALQFLAVDCFGQLPFEAVAFVGTDPVCTEFGVERAQARLKPGIVGRDRVGERLALARLLFCRIALVDFLQREHVVFIGDAPLFPVTQLRRRIVPVGRALAVEERKLGRVFLIRFGDHLRPPLLERFRAQAVERIVPVFRDGNLFEGRLFETARHLPAA
jgi:hypothetical protein